MRVHRKKQYSHPENASSVYLANYGRRPYELIQEHSEEVWRSVQPN